MAHRVPSLSATGRGFRDFATYGEARFMLDSVPMSGSERNLVEGGHSRSRGAPCGDRAQIRSAASSCLALFALACAEPGSDRTDRASAVSDGGGGCPTSSGATLVLEVPADLEMGELHLASGSAYFAQWPRTATIADPSTIFAVRLPCGAPLPVSEGGRVIDVSNGYAYWGNASGIFRVLLTSGSKALLARITSEPTLLEVVGQSVFFADATGSIYRVPIDGGTPVLLASSIPSIAGIAASDQNVYVTSFVEPKYNPLLDGGWGPQNTGSLWSAPVSGGGEATLVESNQQEPAEVVVSADSVYWIDGSTSGIDSPNSDGSIMQRPLAGGAATRLVTGETGPHNLSLQGDTLYWMNMWMGGSAIRKFVLPNGPATDAVNRTILPSGNYGGGFAVDEQRLYWGAWTIEGTTIAGTDQVWSFPR